MYEVACKLIDEITDQVMEEDDDEGEDVDENGPKKSCVPKEEVTKTSQWVKMLVMLCQSLLLQVPKRITKIWLLRILPRMNRLLL